MATSRHIVPPPVDYFMRYEQGDMTEDETVEFFQWLVDTGMAWHGACKVIMAGRLLA